MSVPADRTAPSGSPEIVTSVIDSPRSAVVKDTAISSGIAVSSAPETGSMVTTGAVTPAVTTTFNDETVVAVSPPSSVDVAVTIKLGIISNGAFDIIPIKLKSSFDPASGVKVRPGKSAGTTVHEPSPRSVPADSTAPDGTPLITTSVMDSEPSVSARATPISSNIGSLTRPTAGSTTLTNGWSATPVTSTNNVVELSAVSPLASTDDALTVIEKSASESAGGVTVSPARSPGVSVQDPSPLSVPADNSAPAGTPEIVMWPRDSEPSVSVSAAPMLREMAVSSAPAASATVMRGPSATASTETFKVEVVVAESPSASVVVTETAKLNSPLAFGGGVTVMPTRSLVSNVQVPSALSVPADSSAPSGTPDTVTLVIISEPSVSTSNGTISNGIAESSAPKASETVTIGASASPVTCTDSSASVLASVPSSEVVATTFNRISPLKFSGGVMESSAIWAGVASTVIVPSAPGATPPMFSVAPSGTPPIVTDKDSDPLDEFYADVQRNGGVFDARNVHAFQAGGVGNA